MCLLSFLFWWVLLVVYQFHLFFKKKNRGFLFYWFFSLDLHDVLSHFISFWQWLSHIKSYVCGPLSSPLISVLDINLHKENERQKHCWLSLFQSPSEIFPAVPSRSSIFCLFFLSLFLLSIYDAELPSFVCPKLATTRCSVASVLPFLEVGG